MNATDIIVEQIHNRRNRRDARIEFILVSDDTHAALKLELRDMTGNRSTCPCCVKKMEEELANGDMTIQGIRVLRLRDILVIS